MYASTKGYEPPDDEDDAIDDEEDDDPHACTWRLEFGESVYDDSILRMINIPNEHGVSSPLKFWFQIFTIVLVISVNFLLQTMIISRVRMINIVNSDDTLNKVFGPPLAVDGSCWRRDNNMFPDFLPTAGKGPEEYTWDCSPMLPMLLSNVSWLDANNDQVWSTADNIEGLGNFYETQFGKVGNLTRTFGRFLNEIKNGKMRSTRQLSQLQRQSETKDFTEIPMKWMRAEQPILHLCNNVDKSLCGNFESRGILKLHVPDALTPGDRVEECRSMHDRCDNLFGELFRNYYDFAEASCGQKDSAWDRKNRITLHTYEHASLYNPSEKDAVTHTTYIVFLALVLVIWWLAVLEELRRVCTWCFVLFAMPCNGNKVTMSDDISTIEAISNGTKSVIFIFVMIPRACIIIALAWIGSQFLIGADSYDDLILNGVALAFISDIDEMMFAALVSQDTKDTLSNTQAKSTLPSCFPCLTTLCNLPTPAAGMLFVISMVAVQVNLALYSPTGKYALAVAYACLCEASGPSCLSAQLLGGDPS